MMQGVITSDREAVFSLSVRGENTAFAVVSTVVDTGYNGMLTLSPESVAELGLRSLGSRRVMLGDGGEVVMLLYEAIVLWHDSERAVQVLATDGGAVAGMSLLYGSRMEMDIVDGGNFTVSPVT